jgi:DNA polymerase III sliding clamp (beta) subunit (PCNA family)
MPFVVDRKKLLKVLTNISHASRGVQYKAVFGRSKGTTLTLWFDSLEGHLWQFLENEESTVEELAFSVNVKNFHKLISAWKSKTISIVQGENQSLVVSSGNSTVNIPYYDDGVGLDIPSEPVGTYIGILPETFISDLMESVAFVGQMSNKPELACVELKVADKGLIINATDSFSAYHSSYPDIQVPMDSVRFNERVIKTLTSVFSQESLQLYKMEDESVILKGENAILQMVSIRLAYPDVSKLLLETELSPFMILNTKNTMETIRVIEAVSTNNFINLRPPPVTDENGGITVGLQDVIMEADLRIEDSKFTATEIDYLSLDARKFKQCIAVFDKNEYVKLEKMNNGFIRITGDRGDSQLTSLSPLSS